MDKNISDKFELLKNYLKGLKSVAVAYSAGVDSTLLLKTAKETLNDNVIAITVKSCFVPGKELKEAEEFCKSENIKHIIIDFFPLENEIIRKNPQDRCYFCKKEIFKAIKKIAKENGINNIVEGSNADDDNDYRPGKRAIEEENILSPLRAVMLTKREIRELSGVYNLKTQNKPSFACLASRFVYGEELTEDKLKSVEKAEDYLFSKGFTQARCRVHGNLARIEVLRGETEKLVQNGLTICEKLKEYGFTYVCADLASYRTGSMNETIKR